MSRILRHAARRLRTDRGFAAAAVLTLALGIGGATAVFSVAEGVLLRPLPYDHPEQLVDLSHSLTVSGVTNVDQSDASYLYYRNANRVFSGVAAYRVNAVNVGSMNGADAVAGAHAERVNGARVSASAFPLLRIAPLRGRAFRDDEDRPGSSPVVIIGERLWRRAYGADPAIVGRRVEIDGVTRDVVGIMPDRFRFPSVETELWLPIGIDSTRTASAAFDYRGIARLRDGVSPDVAASDLQRLLPHLPESFPGRLTAGAIAVTKMRAVVRPLRDVVVGDIGRALWVVLGAVGFVLLICCGNVANLFLVRAESRHQDLVIRRALGAGRRAIVAELLSEGTILATLGGTIGVALAVAGVGALRALESAGDIPRLDEVGIDGRVLALSVAVTVLAALLVSAIPAFRAATDASPLALEVSRSSTAGRRRHRARNALVVSQMALAFVLVVAAGLMVRTFEHLRSVQPGFDARQAWTFRIALPAAEYAAAPNAARFVTDAIDRLGALPGVTAVGAVTKLPLVDEARRDSALYVEDKLPGMGQPPNVHQVAYATPGYFRALSIPLIEGRVFTQPDPSLASREVVLSRAVVARYWPDGHAVGKLVHLSSVGAAFTVVGVVGDVRGTALEQPPDEIVYLPLVTAIGETGKDTPWTPLSFALVVRSTESPASLAPALERTMRSLAPAAPVYAARAMTDVVSHAGRRVMFTLLLLSIASCVALALGAVGIYGVISFVVSMRTRELAIRQALGARPQEVLRMTARQGLTVAAVGIVVGLVAAVAMTRVLAALLFGVAPRDPATLTTAAVVTLMVAAVAVWLPARRASRVDPALALRAE